MKILFVRPNPTGLIARVGRRHNRAWPPLDFLNCAALARKLNAKVDILDLQADNISSDKLIKKVFDATIIIVTTSALDRWQCPSIDIEKYIRFIRKLPQEKTILMGAHGTIDPKNMLQKTRVKAVIRGEPEGTIEDLVKNIPIDQIKGLSYLIKEKLQNNSDQIAVDIKSLPLPAYDLIDLKNYRYELLGHGTALIETSRGCNFCCTFCFKEMYGNGIRDKTFNQIDEEIGHVIKSGASSIYFFDLEFTFQRQKVLHVCKMMSRHPSIKWCCQTRTDLVDKILLQTMAKSGCRLIHYGIESGSKRILSLIKKPIDFKTTRNAIKLTHAVGIKTACFFLFGFPSETYAEMKKTLVFAKSLNPTYASFHIVTPYPKTDLYKSIVERNSSIRYYGNTVKPAILERFTSRAFLSYYIRPRYWLYQALKIEPQLWIQQIKLLLGFVK